MSKLHAAKDLDRDPTVLLFVYIIFIDYYGL